MKSYQSDRSSFNRFITGVKPYLLPGLILIVAITARVLPGARTIDDAYITYRYARNILAGNGFVFNPGEHVLGTTTPLYTILLVIIGAFTGGTQAPFPFLALLINAIADAATCLLILDIGRRLGSILAGIGGALIWAIAPFSVTFAIGGLETSVYILLLVATVTAHLRKRPILAAFLGALSLLTRPDAMILIGLIGLDRVFQVAREIVKDRRDLSDGGETVIVVKKKLKHNVHRVKILQEIAAFIVPLLPWLIFATLYFGSPVPHSILAKALAYRLEPIAGLSRFLQHFATPFNEDLTFGRVGILIGLVLYPFLSIIGILRAIRINPRGWPFLLYPWFYFAVFSIANPLIFRWYLTPPLPAYFLTIIMGLEQLLTGVKGIRVAPSSFSVHPRYKRIILTCIIIIPLILVSRAWVLRPDHGLDHPAPDMAWYQLELLYRQAAEVLAPELNTQNVLAAGDVGVLGYFTPARILDTVGLNSPESSHYYPLNPAYYVISYAIPPDLIMDEKPDFIVLLEVYGREGLLKDSRFWQTYQLHTKLSTDIYGSDGMLIFKKIR